MIYLLAPYRNRFSHFKKFIEHYTKFLDLTKVKIIIFEQTNLKPFNKGLLHNCGIKYIMEHYCLNEEDTIILNDIDCLIHPRKIELLMENPNDTIKHIYGFRQIWFESFFCLGGIFSVKVKNFIKTNGFPNDYWGWGGEDMALGFRAKKSGIEVDNSKIIEVSNIRDLIRLKNPDHESKIKKKATNLINLAKLELEQKNPEKIILNGFNNCVYSLVGHIKTDKYDLVKLDI